MLNQDKLFVDFETRIPTDVSLYPKKAKEASRRRAKRIGAYALSPRAKGFNKAISNLWIPYSQGESTTVVYAPEPKIIQDKRMAEQRVIEKYEGSEISEKSIKAWGRFAAYNTEYGLRNKFQGYKEHAQKQIDNLSTAFKNKNQEYDYSSITESEVAIEALGWYLISLKSFAGRDDDGNLLLKRKWVQPRWTKVVAEEMSKANDYIEAQNNEDLFLLYEEAYFNNWARSEYWLNVQREHRKYVLSIQNQEPEYVEVPLEAYEGYYY